MKITYAYLAGIIDGEGCISIRKCKQGKYVYFKPMIEVGMTVKAPIEFLAKTFGGSVWYEVIRKSGKNQHKWRVTGTNIVPIIKAILPHLMVKQEQANLCLKLCSYIQPRKGHSNKWTPQERIFQESVRLPLFEKMYLLNHN